MAELLRAGAVGLAFLLIFATAEFWQRCRNPPVEWSRKFVHFMGGLLVLGFPWIFETRWSVLVLAASFAAMIWSTRRIGLLQSVHGVSRASHGGLFYPLGVVLLFTLAYDRPVLYLAAALTLIVADTAAALLGSAYGRKTYAVEDDHRSIEGSAVFLLVTFLAVHVPLLLMTGIDRYASVLVAVHVAMVVTLFEGVSLRGSDNLLIPLGAYLLLLRLTAEPVSVVSGHIVALVATLVLLGIVAWRSHLLTTSGVMAASLFFYWVYALGGVEWLAAPAMAVLGLAGLRAVLGSRVSLPEAEYQVVATFYAVAVAILLLIASDIVRFLAEAPQWLGSAEALQGPYTGAIIGQVAIVATTQLQPFGPGRRRPPSIRATLALLAAAFLVLGPPVLWLTGGLSTLAVSTSAAIALMAVTLYWVARRLSGWPAEQPWNMRLQAACVAAATVVVVPVHLLVLAGG
ncbi:MAG: hypothetical protein BMS9Abin29_0370 [Gemmatimonadota bacterium]|nr:MAG: hypothetical protein BMS9Abin29_0370 [Gemmatimonadota bacterium]